MDRLFCKGYTWGWCSKSGDYQKKAAEHSMKRLASNGLDWICITVNVFQETFYSTRIFPLFGFTQTDEDIIHAINMAKTMNLKVCLKPVVNCMDKNWRARISFPPDNQTYWDKWFESYNNFMIHYAKIAERTDCEMLCTGCEMEGMDKQTERCRKLIKTVRKNYHGLIMHNVNHGDEMKFPWLTDVDVVGISAYYSVSTPEDRSLEYMKKAWLSKIDILEKTHKYYNKPVMFAEIGVRNERGCTMYPYDFIHRPEIPLDEEEQADFYESAMWATWDQPWFAGYFWWDWKAILPPEKKAHENRDFTVYGKKAEKVLQKWYSKK